MNNKMKEIDFLIACTERTILPSVAIEREEIQEALKNRDEKKVLELFDTLF